MNIYILQQHIPIETLSLQNTRHMAYFLTPARSTGAILESLAAASVFLELRVSLSQSQRLICELESLFSFLSQSSSSI